MRFPLPPLLLRCLLGLAALSTFLLVPAAAQADDPPTPISAGAGADWGVKESFRNYVLGPIAHGSISVSDGASQNPDGSFHFPVASGEYDPVTGATSLGFSGSVLFQGHDGALEVKLSNPRVELTPEGSALFADMISKPNIPGASPTLYPGVQVGDLDLTGKEPSVDSTTTTWPGLPATLNSAAIAAFAGFYGAGTGLDSLSFGYNGPGGAPLGKTWTPAGTSGWAKVLTGTVPVGVVRATFDPARDRIWVGSYDLKKVVALNDETLAPAGIEVSTDHNTRNLAVDPPTGNLYSVDTEIRAVRDGGSGFALDPTPIDTFSGGSNALATAPDGTLYSVVESSLFRYRPAAGMVRETFEIPAGYGAVQVSADGKIFLMPSGAPPVAEVTITGSTATLDPIPGTNAVSGVAIAPDRVAFVELDYSEYPKVTTTLHELTPDGSGGWNDRQVAGLSGVSNAYGVWSGDGKTLFLASSDFKDVVVVENDTIVNRIKGPGYLSSLQPGPDGSVYALWRDGSIARLGVATSPTVTTQPEDVSLAVESEAASGVVEISAAAEGEPAPTVQWQRRAPGSARWTDLEGETGEMLSVVAGSADSGARYRAVFINAGGELASAAATLTVQVTPPGTATPGTGGGAAPVPAPIQAAAAKPKIAKLAATRKLGSSRNVTAARLSCPAAGGRCAVTVPRRVSIKIDGERFAATVLAPKSLAPGSVVPLKVRLPKAAAERLSGGEAKLRLRVVLSTDAAWSAQTIEVTLTS